MDAESGDDEKDGLTSEWRGESRQDWWGWRNLKVYSTDEVMHTWMSDMWVLAHDAMLSIIIIILMMMDTHVWVMDAESGDDDKDGLSFRLSVCRNW